jgi:HNH endonuclease
MEIKAQIPDFPDYMATTEGQILSYKGKYRTERILKGQPSPNYLHVTLRRNGRSYVIAVHTLVLLTFRGPRPPGCEGRHHNGNNFDNRLENLFYATHSVNMRDQVRHGTHKEARKTHCAQGHSYAENTMPPLKGRPNSRRCRKCHNIWMARWRAKKLAAATANQME